MATRVSGVHLMAPCGARVNRAAYDGVDGDSERFDRGARFPHPSASTAPMTRDGTMKIIASSGSLPCRVNGTKPKITGRDRTGRRHPTESNGR
jgi:hypothetical protein